MADSSVAKKLGIKPGQRVLVVNAPDDYWNVLGTLPDGIEVKTSPDGAFDVVQAFVYSQAEATQQTPQALAAAKPGALIWLCYPKKTSKIKTDISRDVGWDAMHGAGWEGIAVISVDETWSAMRFRPSSDVKRSKE